MILYKTTSTANDFVRAEVQEHGWDYVDAMFASGYEPMAPKGFWCWMQPFAVNAVKAASGSSTLNLPSARSAINSPRRVTALN